MDKNLKTMDLDAEIQFFLAACEKMNYLNNGEKMNLRNGLEEKFGHKSEFLIELLGI